MSIFNRPKNSQGRFLSIFNGDWDEIPQSEKFRRLELYYSNNSLYDENSFASYYHNEWMEAMKPFRNPTNRSVEFYVSKLCQGSPKINTENTSVQDAIAQYLAWSNFDVVKRVMLRKDALLGNLFIKTVFDGEKVYQEHVDPKNVTWFDADSRGFLTEIRIDAPMDNNMWHTEYWVAGRDGYVAVWEGRHTPDTDIKALGSPMFTAFLRQFGIDFIPITHAKFKDTGDLWGMSCIEHAILKIDEVNRKHTRMSQLLFQYNKPIYGVTSSGRDANGRPFPVKRITRSNVDANMDDTNMFIYVEGSDIKSLIPDLNWSDVLSILKSDEEELQQDLPELRYYTIREQELSGVAIRTLLAGALDRAKEAQESFNSAQEHSNEIALTMGKFLGVFPKLNGTYENGDFKHTVEFAEIIPSVSQNDKATSLVALKDIDFLSPEAKLSAAGYSAEEIAALLAITSK